MVFIQLTEQETKNVMEFLETDFPSFIREGELEDMNYIGDICNVYKKLKESLENTKLNNDNQRKDGINYDDEVYGEEC